LASFTRKRDEENNRVAKGWKHALSGALGGGKGHSAGGERKEVPNVSIKEGGTGTGAQSLKGRGKEVRRRRQKGERWRCTGLPGGRREDTRHEARGEEKSIAKKKSAPPDVNGRTKKG